MDERGQVVLVRRGTFGKKGGHRRAGLCRRCEQWLKSWEEWWATGDHRMGQHGIGREAAPGGGEGSWAVCEERRGENVLAVSREAQEGQPGEEGED